MSGGDPRLRGFQVPDPVPHRLLRRIHEDRVIDAEADRVESAKGHVYRVVVRREDLDVREEVRESLPDFVPQSGDHVVAVEEDEGGAPSGHLCDEGLDPL